MKINGISKKSQLCRYDNNTKNDFKNRPHKRERQLSKKMEDIRDIELNHLNKLLDAFPLMESITIGDITRFIEKHPWLKDKIKQHIPHVPFFNSSMIYVIYYLVDESPWTIKKDWPFPGEYLALEMIFSDLGISYGD